MSPENGGGSENDAVEVVAAVVSLLLLHLSNWRENGNGGASKSSLFEAERHLASGDWAVVLLVREEVSVRRQVPRERFLSCIYFPPQENKRSSPKSASPEPHRARNSLWDFFRCGRSDVSVTSNG